MSFSFPLRRRPRYSTRFSGKAGASALTSPPAEWKPVNQKTATPDGAAGKANRPKGGPNHEPSAERKKERYDLYRIFLGGGGWIRTTEAKRNRFTVCPLWPLGNSSIWNCGAGGRIRTPDLLITNQLLYRLSYTSASRVLSNSRCYSTRKCTPCQQLFSFFQKNFCAPMSGPPGPWRQRGRLPVTTQRRWCVTRIRGFPGLLPALRDLQLAAPVSLCPLCGEEQYRGDQMLRRNGRLICVRCADRLSRAERREEKEDGEP